MLWLFAVAAVIGAALWGAVRIQHGLEPAPGGDSGPGGPGKRDGAGPVGGRLPGGAGKAAGAWRPACGRAAPPAPRSSIAAGKSACAGTSG